jgi:hypothetical protein
MEAEKARKKAEVAEQAAQASRDLQAQLQTQLQQLAAEEAAAAHEFAKRKEKMARETQAVVQRLHMLQNNLPYPSAPSLSASVPEKTLYPPHLNNSLPLSGRPAAIGHQLQRVADPITPATGPAEPYNLA